MRHARLFVALVLAATAALPAAAQAPADTLGRIRAAKAINVAFAGDSLPFSFVDKDTRPAGYSIDLCNKVIAGIARAVGEPNIKVNWKIGTTAERLAMVADGRAELECGNTTPTLGRMKTVDFSSMVFVDSSGLMVRRDAKATRFGELGGRKIAVIGGTTTEARLQTALKERLVNAEVVRVRDAGEAVAMLDAGSVHAFASDKLKLVGAALQSKDAKALAVLEENISLEPYAFALPRNDSAYRLEVNRALAQVFSGGELQSIFGRWFGSLGPPSGLLLSLFALNALPE
jgi:polar amino acid transport system substrate-binding protein/glutamate/aspartate transport system substrate-binding protein